ncbi:MAG: DsbA family protein [Patescibacteria group bacterium]
MENMDFQNLTKKERKALKRQMKEERKETNFTARKRKKIIGWGLLGVAMVFVIFIIIWFVKNGGNSEFSFELDAQNPQRGATEATVVIREFSDFQCPACRSFSSNINQFMKEYGDKVKHIFYDFPLVSIHKNSLGASMAARCAEVQGNFWGYHDMLFDRQKNWEISQNSNDVFVGYAEELDLDGNALRVCLDEKRYEEIVKKNLDKANKLGLNSTPTIFINDKKFKGVLSVDDLKKEVDLLLNRK